MPNAAAHFIGKNQKLRSALLDVVFCVRFDVRVQLLLDSMQRFRTFIVPFRASIVLLPLPVQDERYDARQRRNGRRYYCDI
ncbi:MAG: hypothetical protein II230_08835, partial [Clostridia bacterium]|nr:hypothetical protein [Clostridia bacterium]